MNNFPENSQRNDETETPANSFHSPIMHTPYGQRRIGSITRRKLLRWNFGTSKFSERLSSEKRPGNSRLKKIKFVAPFHQTVGKTRSSSQKREWRTWTAKSLCMRSGQRERRKRRGEGHVFRAYKTNLIIQRLNRVWYNIIGVCPEECTHLQLCHHHRSISVWKIAALNGRKRFFFFFCANVRLKIIIRR